MSVPTGWLANPVVGWWPTRDYFLLGESVCPPSLFGQPNWAATEVVRRPLGTTLTDPSFGLDQSPSCGDAPTEPVAISWRPTDANLSRS